MSLSVRQSVTLQDTGDTVTHTAHGHLDGEAVLFATIDQTTGIETEAVYYLRRGSGHLQAGRLARGCCAGVTTDGTGSVVYLDARRDRGTPSAIGGLGHAAFGISTGTYDRTLSVG